MRARFMTKCLLMLSLLVAGVAQAAVEIAVVAPRGAAEATARWGELAKFLSNEIKQPVVILPLTAAKIFDSAANGEADFVLSHSVHTVQLLEKVDGQLIATVNGPSGAHFGGVIVAKKGSGITKLNDLRGKKVMSMKFRDSAGAYVFQTYELNKAGIDPHKDFASFTEGAKQDELIMAVKNGSVDAVFVRTGLLEDMAKDGKITLDEFEIVNAKKEPNFSEALSTALYPEWCVTGLSHVPADTLSAVKGALLKLTAESAAARAAEIQGFVTPIPLDSIKEVLKALKISPYDK